MLTDLFKILEAVSGIFGAAMGFEWLVNKIKKALKK